MKSSGATVTECSGWSVRLSSRTSLTRDARSKRRISTRAVSSSEGTSSYSNLDLATLITFTDDPIVPGATVVRASHVLEMRTAVNAVRAAAGLPAFTFTDASLVGALAKALHVLQLRSALAEARAVIGVSAITHANSLNVGVSVIRAIEMQELRAGIR
jgi:hypothetical protein